jgi:hypothetical protein
MPETYLLFRFFFEKEGITEDWWNAFKNLSYNELHKAKKIIEHNDFKVIEEYKSQNSIYEVLKHYTVSRDQIADSNSELSKLKAKFDKLEKAEKYGVIENIECL